MRLGFAVTALCLVLAGCSGSGADGEAVPPPGALDALRRPATPNTALAAPAGFAPAPDIVTPVFDMPAAALFAAITKVADEMPRTYRLARYENRLEAAYVARSLVFNFPDTIIVKVQDKPPGSTLTLYSASRYGESDFSVNRKRVSAWLAALEAAIKK